MAKDYFIQVPKIVLRRRDLSHGAKLLYGLILHFARIKGKGFAYPGIRWIMAELGCAMMSVQGYIKELKEHALVKVESGTGVSNKYTPTVPDAGTVEEREVYQKLVRKCTRSCYGSVPETGTDTDKSNKIRSDKFAGASASALSPTPVSELKRGPIRDAVAAAWCRSGVPPSRVKEIEKVVTDLMALIDATPEEIGKRTKALRRMALEQNWGKPTVHALVKRWEDLNEQSKRGL